MEVTTLLQQAVSTQKLSANAEATIRDWLTKPKYAEYKAELEKLIEQKQWQILEDNFFKIVPFGTGGRRGTVGIGSNRINRVTIGESAQGMANYLLTLGQHVKKQGIVIAYDTRLTSVQFSQLVASVFAANGFTVYLFDGFRATPELSFAVRHLNAAAGVVVSASHNPPSDNGFKAYWHDGGQVVPPHDAGIMEHVAKVETIVTTDFSSAQASGNIQMIGPEVDQAYIKAVVNESLVPTRSAIIAYSPLHGTGSSNALRVLESAGFKNITVAQEQASPDGHFPHIKNNIPNPEVPDTNQLVTDYAKRVSADFAMTTDPDADRLGVVARDETGNYQFLTGNQIAALLGYFVLDQMKQQGKLKPNHFLAKTIVTTDFLRALAKDFGVPIEDNILIGFKYVAELIRLKEGTHEFLFGGEESHGILKGSYTRDKDAAVAALLMAELASYLKDQGKNLVWQLNELYKKYGVYWETLHNIVYPGASGATIMAAIMQRLRDASPQAMGTKKVVRVIDRLTAADTKGDVLVFVLSDDARTRVTVRPSGTEPKLKIYTQVHLPLTLSASKDELTQTKRKAEELALALQTAMINQCAATS